MSLTTRISAAIAGRQVSALDLASAAADPSLAARYDWASGVGTDQADRIFSDRRTIAASANDDLDLAGGLTDAFGAAITFARIKALMVKAAAANANNVLVGGDATNTWLTWVGAEPDNLIIRPGGLILLTAPDATAYPVTAATGDLLRISNSGAGTSVTYDIVIVGASA